MSLRSLYSGWESGFLGIALALGFIIGIFPMLCSRCTGLGVGMEFTLF